MNFQSEFFQLRQQLPHPVGAAHAAGPRNLEHADRGVSCRGGVQIQIVVLRCLQAGRQYDTHAVQTGDGRITPAGRESRLAALRSNNSCLFCPI